MSKRAVLLAAAMTIAITGIAGCSDVKDGDDGPRTRDVDAARADAKELSSQLLDLLALKGKVTENGPGVGVCEGRDSSRFYTVHHPWSVYEVPVADMRKAMARLKEKLPEHGWDVVGYGPDKSASKALTLQADNDAKKFSVRIKLWEEGDGSDNPSMIHATLVSTCFAAPEGEDVSGDY